MKQHLRYANLLALVFGSVGMLLSIWLFSAGTDDKGLFPASHPAWLLLGILTAAVAVLFWLLSRQGGIDRSFRRNFPASILAALGCVLAAIGLILNSLSNLRSASMLPMLTGILGLGSGVCLLWGAVCRFRGVRSRLPIHALPCFFFALQLFALGQEFGSEPEMQRYLYRFWATTAMVPACYCLWSFDVGLGKRVSCIFWCLVAGYCNLTAAVGSGDMLLHLCLAAWMLTALPVLKFLPKQPKAAPAQVEATAEDAQSEAVPEATEVFDLPGEPAPEAMEAFDISCEPALDDENAQDTLLSPQLPDTEAILQELLRDYGQAED